MPHVLDPSRPNPHLHSTAPCPGRCNSAWRAAERRYEATGTDHDLHPRDGQPVWCPPCTTAIRSALSGLRELAVRLHMEVDAGVSAALSEPVSGSKERRLHEHQDASFLLEEIAMFLADWDDTVRRDRHLPSLRATGLSHERTVDSSAWFLLKHLDWILGAHPETEVSEGFGSDTLYFHRRAQTLTGTADVLPERCDGIPCPSCDYYALEHEVNDSGVVTGAIRCRRCMPPLRLTGEEYQRWTAMLDADVRRRGLATPEVLAFVFGGTQPRTRAA